MNNDTQGTPSSPPLPPPIVDPFAPVASAPRPALAAKFLGTAAVFLLFSALLRAAVEATYIIGAYQAHVTPSFFRLAFALVHIVFAGYLFRPLKRGQDIAHGLAVTLSVLFAINSARELFGVVMMRLRGYTDTETQIVLLFVLMVSLTMAVGNLMRANRPLNV